MSSFTPTTKLKGNWLHHVLSPPCPPASSGLVRDLWHCNTPGTRCPAAPTALLLPAASLPWPGRLALTYFRAVLKCYLSDPHTRPRFSNWSSSNKVVRECVYTHAQIKSATKKLLFTESRTVPHLGLNTHYNERWNIWWRNALERAVMRNTLDGRVPTSSHSGIFYI